MEWPYPHERGVPATTCGYGSTSESRTLFTRLAPLVGLNGSTTIPSWRNLTTGRRFSTTTPYSSSMDTAEWIEETPLIIGTGGTGLAAMPNLGTVHFTSATLNHANPSYHPVDEMQLVNSSGRWSPPRPPQGPR